MKISRLAYDVGLRLKAFEHKKILVALSGGRDSCVMLQILLELKTRLGLEIGIAHYHHGDSQCSELQSDYRQKALEFSAKTALQNHIEFFYYKSDSSLAPSEMKKPEKGLTRNLQSEASLRKVRLEFLEKIRKEQGFDFIALAHHAQDLFETRLIRLIRGTGKLGLVAMSLQTDFKLRPILNLWPNEIGAYAKQNEIFYLEDPSNSDSRYLRNWLRNEWLRTLETKKPGAMQAFARSLELLAPSGQNELVEELWMRGNQAAIDREKFMTLSPSGRRQAIANYLGQFAKKNYSSNMVQEICKRLDTSQKELRFKVAGFEWTANAKQIQARNLAKFD